VLETIEAALDPVAVFVEAGIMRTAATRHGHSGQADRARVAMAEWVRGETDRHDPTGMRRPPDRVRSGATCSRRPPSPILPNLVFGTHKSYNVLLATCGRDTQAEAGQVLVPEEVLLFSDLRGVDHALMQSTRRVVSTQSMPNARRRPVGDKRKIVELLAKAFR
jgi:hypothetical protein